MPKITAKTTLSELALIRGKLGIEFMACDFDPARMHGCIATLYTREFRVRGTGETEYEALDDAVTRLQHRIGRREREQQEQDFITRVNSERPK